MKKILVIIIGESFRSGNQGTRTRGEFDSYREQQLASLSQVDFLKTLEKKGVEFDIALSTYSTVFDAELLNWYASSFKLVYTAFGTELKFLDGLFKEIIRTLTLQKRLHNYDGVFYLRIDLMLKEALKKTLVFPENEVLFPFNTFSACFLEDNVYPRVSDMFMYLPRAVFYCIDFEKMRIYHTSWATLETLGVPKIQIKYLINTMHDSDSFKDWNPFYFIANRGKNFTWMDQGKQFNPYTLEIKDVPIPEIENIYVRHATEEENIELVAERIKHALENSFKKRCQRFFRVVHQLSRHPKRFRELLKTA